MTFIFNINYHTTWGQQIFLTITAPIQKEIPLICIGSGKWEGEIPIPVRNGKTVLQYFYRLIEHGLCIREESDEHILRVDSRKENIIIKDCWIDSCPNSLESSSAFLQCIYSTPKLLPKNESRHKVNATFFIHSKPPRDKKMTLALSGNIPSLGFWKEAIPLKEISPYNWAGEINVPFDREMKEIQYKYVLIDQYTLEILSWEDGENRVLSLPKTPNNSHVYVNDNKPRIKERPWKGAGVVIPLFSLRTKDGFGVGDIGILHDLIDWCKNVGMSCIQLLPLNDTTQTGTWHDSYPYNSVSVFALHPIYLNVTPLLPSLSSKEIEYIQKAGQELDKRPELDYERTFALKKRVLRDYFEVHFPIIAESNEYRLFIKENENWLFAYAAFSTLRDLYHNADFRSWPKFSTYSEVENCSSSLRNDPVFSKEMDFVYMTQFVLFKQLEEVHQYARECHVILKGDIPIGISRNSVPAWAEGNLFNFKGSAGAPPDAFSKNGQNWGFPTYRWKEMEKDHFLWWRRRLKVMSHFFDAYRIDHVLGFFRIWQIPYGRKDGVLGHFVPAIPLSKEELDMAGVHLIQNQVFDSSKDLSVEEETVLWIRDEYSTHHYHPSYAAKESLPYKQMSPQEKEAFDRIYEDYFYHRHNDFWRDEAFRKLPALTHATNMLPCAEDLGMVPSCVGPVLDQLKILSLEIERMPKGPNQIFADTSKYPYLSVATIATHDMPPLRLWLRQNKALANLYIKNILHNSSNIEEMDETMLCELVVERHLESPSILCLLSLQDWTSIDSLTYHPNPEMEQINDPSNPSQYWNYRMHLTLDQLMQSSSLNNKIRSLILKTNRQP